MGVAFRAEWKTKQNGGGEIAPHPLAAEKTATE